MAVVLAALAAIQMVRASHHVLLLLLVAGFVAVVLNPLVDAVQRRVPSRVAATAIVFTAGTVIVAGLAALFVGPLATRFPAFLDDLPGIIRRAQSGDGPVAEVARRLDLQHRLGDSLPDIRKSVGSWSGPGLAIAKGLLAGVLSVLLLAVLSFMMLLEFPRWSRSARSNLSPSAADRVSHVARDIGHAVFLGYQQLENHVLVPVIMGKTVKLRPIWVLVSVLVGAQLLGLVGAFLAVPVAAAIQIVAQDLWAHRRSAKQPAVSDPAPADTPA